MASWLVVMEWLSRLVLALLFGLSFWSVAIMVDRSKVFKRLERADSPDAARKLIEAGRWDDLEQWAKEGDGIRAASIRAALSVPPHEAGLIDRSVRSVLSERRPGIEQGLTTLATLGSNAPFIGLFGTVLGIIHAFGVLGGGQGETNAVMQGISEALVATAVGLLVAIPAVVAYNVFTRRLRLLLLECESLKDLYVARRARGSLGR